MLERDLHLFVPRLCLSLDFRQSHTLALPFGFALDQTGFHEEDITLETNSVKCVSEVCSLKIERESGRVDLCRSDENECSSEVSSHFGAVDARHKAVGAASGGKALAVHHLKGTIESFSVAQGGANQSFPHHLVVALAEEGAHVGEVDCHSAVFFVRVGDLEHVLKLRGFAFGSILHMHRQPDEGSFVAVLRQQKGATEVVAWPLLERLNVFADELVELPDTEASAWHQHQTASHGDSYQSAC